MIRVARRTRASASQPTWSPPPPAGYPPPPGGTGATGQWGGPAGGGGQPPGPAPQGPPPGPPPGYQQPPAGYQQPPPGYQQGYQQGPPPGYQQGYQQPSGQGWGTPPKKSGLDIGEIHQSADNGGPSGVAPGPRRVVVRLHPDCVPPRCRRWISRPSAGDGVVFARTPVGGRRVRLQLRQPVVGPRAGARGVDSRRAREGRRGGPGQGPGRHVAVDSVHRRRCRHGGFGVRGDLRPDAVGRLRTSGSISPFPAPSSRWRRFRSPAPPPCGHFTPARRRPRPPHPLPRSTGLRPSRNSTVTDGLEGAVAQRRRDRLRAVERPRLSPWASDPCADREFHDRLLAPRRGSPSAQVRRQAPAAGAREGRALGRGGPFGGRPPVGRALVGQGGDGLAPARRPGRAGRRRGSGAGAARR